MKLKPNFEKARCAPSITSLAIRMMTTSASTEAAAQIKNRATSPNRSTRLRAGLCRFDRASFSDAVPAGGVALIAANVEEVNPYGVHLGAIFTRLKHLLGLSHSCYQFVTEVIHENETKSSFGGENLRADNPTPLKGTLLIRNRLLAILIAVGGTVG